jgi:mannan endo-1,4-beta-mannosidase
MKSNDVLLKMLVLNSMFLVACAQDGSNSGGSGGKSAGSSESGGQGAGGAVSSGGSNGTGGSSASSGGSSGSGGKVGTGGSNGTGGATSKGGSTGSGGVTATGGTTTGSTASTGGSTGTGGTTNTGGSSGTNTHMYTQGSDLYAYCGEKVLLRGVNQMSVWTDPKGSSYPAIASFGSNVVRIVYNATGTASGLDALMTKAEDNKMIPMPENHDATGKFDQVDTVVNWWTQPAIVDVIKKHEKWTLLNIANEAGDNNVSDSTLQSTYTSAITSLRNAGITVPLVIDATGWAQNIEQLLGVAPALLAADPQKNVIFSWHEYTGGTDQNARITTSYEQSKTLGIVLINGEFANGGVGDGCDTTIPYKWLMSEAQRVGIGWLAWSWDTTNSDCKVGSDSIFNMTTKLTSADGVASGWASDVMRDDPNSIKNTSVRPCEWK